MTDTADTIELLEAIGSDASLRYAQAGELRGVLVQAKASIELATALMMGDSSPLRAELGVHQVPQSPQSPTQVPGYEPEEEEEEGDVSQPEGCQAVCTSSSSSQRDSAH
ncbi:MAG: hypothetical protein KGI63_10265 [Xanthomonadaceae bacterium]|nr:hypothetical protein [Xanthomonadaceae bacterium]